MRLARCPHCDKIIDLDDVDEIPGDTVMGCGLKEGMYESCAECGEEYNSDDCAEIRKGNNITKTTASDIMEATDVE